MKMWSFLALVTIPGMAVAVACGSSVSCPAGERSVTVDGVSGCELALNCTASQQITVDGVSTCCPTGTKPTTVDGIQTCGGASTSVGVGSTGSFATSTGTNMTNGSTGTNNTVSSTTTGMGTGGSSGSGGSTSGGDCDTDTTAAACQSDCKTEDTCITCITSVDMTGYNTFNTDINVACGCTSGATCYSVCSTDPLCPSGNGNPGTACANCINGIMQGDACITAGQNKCTNDTQCKAFLTDVQPCLKLPM